MLAEAERGMLVHCCCFVVNLVRGYTAARPLDALHQLCQVTSSPVSETYSDTFYAFWSTDIRVHRGEVVFFFYFYLYFFVFFGEDVLTFFKKKQKLKLSCCIVIYRGACCRQAYVGHARPSCRLSLDPGYES